MTASVKLSLMALRGYPILMILLWFYHVMDLAGAFGSTLGAVWRIHRTVTLL